MSIEIERITAFDAEEFAVDAGTVAIIGANDFAVADAECSFAAVGTVSANGTDMLHLPGTGFVAVGTGGKRADRTDVDTGAALVAFQMIAAVGNDFSGRAAIADTEGIDAQTFAADAHAAIAENAAWRIVKNDRRPLLFVDVAFWFRGTGFRQRHSGKPCPAVRTRRLCRRPGNRAG